MKIIIVEIVDGESGVSTVTLRSQFSGSWDDSLMEYEITHDVLEVLQDQETWGWVSGKNRFGQSVRRTYMLVEG